MAASMLEKPKWPVEVVVDHGHQSAQEELVPCLYMQGLTIIDELRAIML